MWPLAGFGVPRRGGTALTTRFATAAPGNVTVKTFLD